MGKIPKRCKIGVAGSENHDESQPRDTVRLHQVRFSNASAVAFPRARPPGVLSGDQVTRCNLRKSLIRGPCGRRATYSRLSRLPGNACIAKILQRALFLRIGNSPLTIPHEHGLPRARTANPSDRGSEYDYPHHRKARAKLRLGDPSVRLESSTLASSATDPQNGKVVPGPCSSGIGVVEIGFECSLLDPSATGGRVVLSLAARTR